MNVCPKEALLPEGSQLRTALMFHPSASNNLENKEAAALNTDLARQASI